MRVYPVLLVVLMKRKTSKLFQKISRVLALGCHTDIQIYASVASAIFFGRPDFFLGENWEIENAHPYLCNCHGWARFARVYPLVCMALGSLRLQLLPVRNSQYFRAGRIFRIVFIGKKQKINVKINKWKYWEMFISLERGSQKWAPVEYGISLKKVLYRILNQTHWTIIGN